MTPNRKILACEIVGVVFITFLGSALHFTYQLSGKLAIIGSFSAVNKSVWEHMKLAFWPSLVWLIAKYLPLRKVTNNFFTAKASGTCLMVFAIPLIFYSYISVTGESILMMDITTFVIAIIVGQILSYRILMFRQLPKICEKIASLVLTLLGASFILFTFYAPHLSIFQDSTSGGYGVS